MEPKLGSRGLQRGCRVVRAVWGESRSSSVLLYFLAAIPSSQFSNLHWFVALIVDDTASIEFACGSAHDVKGINATRSLFTDSA